MDRQPLGDRGEFLPGANRSFGAKLSFENCSDRGHEGRAAGHKDRINVLWTDVATCQQAVYAIADLPDLRNDPAFELFPTDRLFNRHGEPGETKCRLMIAGKGALGSLDGLIKSITEIVIDEVDEGFDFLRFDGLEFDLAQQLHIFARF